MNEQSQELAKLSADLVQIERFKTAYLEEGNATRAYIKLHPDVTYDSARVLGHRMLAKVNMSELMEEFGLTRKLVIQGIKMGIEEPTRLGKKLVTVRKKNKTTGEVTEAKEIREMEVPDFAIRKQYVELAMKAHKMIGIESREAGNTFEADDMTFVFVTPEGQQPQQPKVIEGEVSESKP